MMIHALAASRSGARMWRLLTLCGLLSLMPTSALAQDRPAPVTGAPDLSWRADPVHLFRLNVSRGATFDPRQLLLGASLANTPELTALLATLGCPSGHDIPSTAISTWRCDASMTPLDRIEILFASHRLWAEAAFYEEQTEEPIDPLQAYDIDPRQWHLHNTGQMVGGLVGTPGADIGAIEAWTITSPETPGRLVAVIDSGIDYLHPDLAGRLYQNPNEQCGNNIDDDQNGYEDDCFGWDFGDEDGDPSPRTLPIDAPGCKRWHGTFMAGLSSGNGGNGEGIAGVHWGVKLINIKKHDDATCSSTTAQSIAATAYASRLGARILQMSFVTTAASALFEQTLKDAQRDGALLVMSSGNDGQSNDLMPLYPANYALQSQVVVAYTDNRDALSPQSNFGTSVDLAAPGENIYSSDQEMDYQIRSGSSYAVPIVAGAASLLWATFPSLRADQIAAALIEGVEPLDALDCATHPQRCVASGGRLSLPGAIEAAASRLTGPSISIQGFAVRDFAGDGFLSAGERATLDYALINRGAPSTKLALSAYAVSTEEVITLQPALLTLPSLGSNQRFEPQPAQLPSLLVSPSCTRNGPLTLVLQIEDDIGGIWAQEVDLQLACSSDLDGDGVPPPQDCDDDDPNVSPSLMERCDGVDNDCDGQIDEAPLQGALTYYLDLDSDGYGREAMSFQGCVQPQGYVTRGGDCDDLDATIYPHTEGGVQVCGVAPTMGGDSCQCDALAARPSRGDGGLWLLLCGVGVIVRRRRRIFVQKRGV